MTDGNEYVIPTQLARKLESGSDGNLQLDQKEMTEKLKIM